MIDLRELDRRILQPLRDAGLENPSFTLLSPSTGGLIPIRLWWTEKDGAVTGHVYRYVSPHILEHAPGPANHHAIQELIDAAINRHEECKL